jgi:chromosomal replication initiation ATPase DnaA
MDRLAAHNTDFLASVIPSFKETAAPRDALQRALAELAVLPPHVSPAVMRLARNALAECQRLNASERLAEIIEGVACKLRMGHEQILSRSRSQRIAFCRHATVYICRSVSGASYPILGAHFHRQPSTIQRSVKLIEKRMRDDAAFRQSMNRLQHDLSVTGTGTIGV